MEQGLFVGARESSSKIGLDEDVGEDISRFLLAKSREAQESTYNRIASSLSHRRTILGAPSWSQNEEQSAIPPMLVEEGVQPLAREDELIKEYRLSGLTESYPENRQEFLAAYGSPRSYIDAGLLSAHRHYHSFSNAREAGKASTVFASLVPMGRAHIGHRAMWDLLRFHRDLGSRVVVSVRDVESVIRWGRLHEAGAEWTLRRAREVAEKEFLPALAAADISQGEFYFQSDRPGIYDLALEIGNRVPLARLIQVFGISLRSHPSLMFLRILNIADVLQHQADNGGPSPFLVCGSLVQDPLVRLSRQVAESMKDRFYSPSGLYMRPPKSLAPYTSSNGDYVDWMIDGASPRGGLSQTQFHERQAKAIIALDDGDDSIARKLRNAPTGGQGCKFYTKMITYLQKNLQI